MDRAVESPIGIVLVEDVVSALPENGSVRIVHPVDCARKWYAGRYGSDASCRRCGSMALCFDSVICFVQIPYRPSGQ